MAHREQIRGGNLPDDWWQCGHCGAVYDEKVGKCDWCEYHVHTPQPESILGSGHEEEQPRMTKRAAEARLRKGWKKQEKIRQKMEEESKPLRAMERVMEEQRKKKAGDDE